MLEIMDNNFEDEVVKSEVPVVVDYWAPWCNPCRMVAPVMEELSKEFEGKVKFVKINVDDNPVVSNSYRVSSIPTIMFFKKGEIIETMVGFRPKQAFKDMIEKHI